MKKFIYQRYLEARLQPLFNKESVSILIMKGLIVILPVAVMLFVHFIGFNENLMNKKPYLLVEGVATLLIVVWIFVLIWLDYHRPYVLKRWFRVLHLTDEKEFFFKEELIRVERDWMMGQISEKKDARASSKVMNQKVENKNKNKI